ncbi:MAG: hypothetical protein ACLT1A_08000 [Dysosmobacter sp.]
MNREAYDSETEWTWTREVVVNGELVEISEVGDSLEWIGNASKNQGEMAQGEWFEVKYDADGNVRKVEAIDFSKAADKFVYEVEGRGGRRGGLSTPSCCPTPTLLRS